MCGIAGIVRRERILETDITRAGRMGEIIAHRGPDDEGLREGVDYVFAHRRLSIIDIAGGHQPMSNEDGTVWLVYNGEIYNYPRLREELASAGHNFRTRCDTEVIIHLYEEHGEELVEHLNGMFAFALYDERRQFFLMARDRAGIKPLYYSSDATHVSFASEAKALVQTSQRLVNADPRSIIDFFSLSLVQEGRTAFAGINELEPAHVLTWEPGSSPVARRYWRPRYGEKTSLAGGELTEALGGTLREAVESHLISDVPVGTYLSGGLDSSLISALADEFLPELNTFSAGFVGKEAVDERRFAREAAAMIGTVHHEVEVGPEDFIENLKHIIWHMDEPTLSPGVYPYYFLCGLVADSVKVVLGGQGSDELFGGYPRYRMGLLERKIAADLSRGRVTGLVAGLAEYRRRYGLGGLKNELRRIKAPSSRRIYEIVSGFHPRQLPRLFSDELRASVAGYDPMEPFSRSLDQCDSDDLIDRMLFNDFHNMLPSILRTEDRMSMAHSIESRVPFLDRHVIELAASIPASRKVVGDEPKLILKQVSEGLVPQSIITRRKQGFSAPIDSWFIGALAGSINELLLGERARARGFFAPAYVKRLLERCFEKKKDVWRVWSLVTFEIWCRIYLDGEVVESGQGAG